MKLTLCVLVAFAALACGAFIDTNSGEGWFVPQVGGGYSWISQQQSVLEAAAIEPRAVAVRFYLYTKSNPNSGRQVNINDAGGLSSAGFNKANPTRFITHGWQNNYLSDVNVEVRSALLATGSYNVFCVDWSSAAETANYNSARNAVSDVGSTVASFIDFLNQSGGMNFGTLGLIGHSLGAHVSGFAGKKVKRGRVNTIHGLDPAYPLFNYNDCSSRLCSSDANYVESIQTNGGLLGFLDPIGKASFYPNGGKSQPGCGVDLTGSCAHSRSYQYYAESIRRNDFPSMKCSSYQNAVGNNCGNTYSSQRMGASSNYGTSGYFYVPVKSSPPYGMAS